MGGVIERSMLRSGPCMRSADGYRSPCRGSVGGVARSRVPLGRVLLAVTRPDTCATIERHVVQRVGATTDGERQRICVTRPAEPHAVSAV